MLPELTHYPVNWVDGMKITRRHFTETNEFVADHLRDATALLLRPDAYGLLPTADGLDSPDGFELLLSVDAQQEVQARLTRCRAITAGGARIELGTASTPLSLRTSLNELLATTGLAATEGQRFSVVVTVNPFERVPTGPPDPAEVPPRHPYTRPRYELSVVPAAELGGAASAAYALVVGELLLADGALHPVPQYIPASVALASHPALLQSLHQLDHQLGELETDALKVVHKVKLRADKRGHLADLVRELAERVVLALAPQQPTLRLLAAHQPPSYLLDALLRVAKPIKSALDLLLEAEREELLRYFEQWTEIPPAAVLGGLQEALALPYDHHRVHEHLAQQQQLWLRLGTIFRQLSQLEYIGKNREGWQTFINENPVAPRAVFTPVPEPEKPGGGLRWSPI